jgi:hypothetical protein
LLLCTTPKESRRGVGKTKYRVVWARKGSFLGRLEDIEPGDWVEYAKPNHGMYGREVERLSGQTVHLRPLVATIGGEECLLIKAEKIPLRTVYEVLRPITEEDRELSPLERMGFILPDDS